MIVADTNLIAYLLINGEHTHLAEKILQKDADWVAPLLWRSELQNTLALTIRQKNMSVSQAIRIMAAAEKVMQSGSYQPTTEKVMTLVASSSCSAYDCEFVALAQDLRIPLVTSDKQVLRDFPQTAVSLSQFANS
jgi:predicted nucleic acid-binding protein